MLATLRRRRENDEEGFTLIELMVVVLIIAILLAIAIPTFLGARQRAQNRAAQSNIRNAFTAEKTYYTDAQAYTSDTTSIHDIEPSLTFTNDPTDAKAKDRKVAINTEPSGDTSPQVLVMVSESASGNCYWIADTAKGANSGTKYGQSTDDCGTAQALLVASTTTADSWS